MRLALENGHADPAVVAALLRAGANPDDDQQYLFGSISDGGGATSGAMITGKNERLLRAVVDGSRPEPLGSGGESAVCRKPFFGPQAARSEIKVVGIPSKFQ
ncbi:hypothetical protein [Bradyrhizobium sp.]|uniref:hypothetical protein n=1 Tax=Bradyrhizobium sp. TaxID=376 RepID=UPI001DC5523E|nr:hypothetical protein [Bradyrhizobium sp.]MBV8701119.1 hypothetical protein [Bradyrhizobium sp.]MBV8920522.1 hypothetical protein [Bradyrhizobium sp.]MBV9981073.1 hypothetical protein [Bradyrhizobium sp.]